MNIEQTETKITQNQTQVPTQNLQLQKQQQELQSQDQNQTTTQNRTTNETTLSTATNPFNSTNLKLTQNNEEEYQLLIKELKSNDVEIGEQEKTLLQKVNIAFLEEMELLKKDRDERLQELRNWYEYNVHNLKKTCSFEKKQAKDEFEVDKGYLKQHMLLDLEKKETKFKQMLQNQQKKQLKSQQPPKNVYQEFLQKLNHENENENENGNENENENEDENENENGNENGNDNSSILKVNKLLQDLQIEQQFLVPVNVIEKHTPRHTSKY
ncbi:breast cancer metastasis-suppressor 1 [Anaeramoeba flamelloides]|uniref:Breast cancer metastasis-suppressor 1 n=1 Tax=Anaeramoeba flamelloides TaxID=1746091 RepID=A0ABQ8YDW1_9EUKA|nr:breast cancer metastasis-suppressor 1 [Anaeramoeba flamelloides]